MYNDLIAGYKKVYDKIVFTTVRGAGHMVPADQPGPALSMFNEFLNGKFFD